jgi:hypothetical protein
MQLHLRARSSEPAHRPTCTASAPTSSANARQPNKEALNRLFLFVVSFDDRRAFPSGTRKQTVMSGLQRQRCLELCGFFTSEASVLFYKP